MIKLLNVYERCSATSWEPHNQATVEAARDKGWEGHTCNNWSLMIMIKIKIMTKIMIMTQGQRDLPAIIGHYCWQLSNDYGVGHCYWQRIKCFGIDHSGSLRWDLCFPQSLRFVSTAVPQKEAFFAFLLLTHWLLRLRPLVRSGPP